MDDIQAFGIWIVIVVLLVTLGYLGWMLSKFFPPLEPREPIAEVKGAVA